MNNFSDKIIKWSLMLSQMKRELIVLWQTNLFLNIQIKSFSDKILESVTNTYLDENNIDKLVMDCPIDNNFLRSQSIFNNFTIIPKFSIISR